MDDALQIDLLAVLLAAIANMIIGFIWYSDWLFGKSWLQLSGISPKKQFKESPLTILWIFFLSLVTAYVLGFFEVFLGVTTVSDGMFVAFLVWLGFVATTQISKTVWHYASFKLFFIETGCKLLSFLVMGGIIGA